MENLGSCHSLREGRTVELSSTLSTLIPVSRQTLQTSVPVSSRKTEWRGKLREIGSLATAVGSSQLQPAGDKGSEGGFFSGVLVKGGWEVAQLPQSATADG